MVNVILAVSLFLNVGTVVYIWVMAKALEETLDEMMKQVEVLFNAR